MKLPPAKERECRKRAMPGKTAATGSGADEGASLPPLPAADPGCGPAVAGMPSDDAPRRHGSGRSGGARAPPAMPA